VLVVIDLGEMSVRRTSGGGGGRVHSKPGPGGKALAEKWAINLILLYSFQPIKDGIVHKPVVVAFEFNSFGDTAGPFIEYVPVLGVDQRLDGLQKSRHLQLLRPMQGAALVLTLGTCLGRALIPFSTCQSRTLCRLTE